MKEIFGLKKLKVLFGYMLLVHTKKSALKSKGFFTFCVHPCSEKKDILLTFSEPCYCHVGEDLLVSLFKKLARSMPTQLQWDPRVQMKN